MGTSVDSSTRLSSSMGSSEHSSTSSPLLEGSAGEFAEARTSEQMKKIMEQMMELKRRCCSAEDTYASMEEKFTSMEDKCTSLAEEVMIVGAQSKILVEKLVESNKCLSHARTKNLESHSSRSVRNLKFLSNSPFRQSRSQNSLFNRDFKPMMFWEPIKGGLISSKSYRDDERIDPPWIDGENSENNNKTKCELKTFV